MTGPSTAVGSLELSGLDGTNPLGFLAALGTLVTVRSAGEAEARLRWTRTLTWVPTLEGISCDPDRFCEVVARGLRGRDVSDEQERARSSAQEAFDAAKKAVEDMRKKIRAQRLKGKERDAAIDADLRPLQQTGDQKRKEWLRALGEAVPRPELALGKRIDCTDEEYREHANGFLERLGPQDAEALNFLAAFGSDARLDKYGRIVATPFCFIIGSGGQFFLDTIRQLIQWVSPERVREALFEPWAYRDKTLSLRWDPIDDRRYALMDRNPTASGNESRTVWMANLLAYRALVLFPTAPRAHLTTTAWRDLDGHAAFTWPVWERAAGPDTIRSLLQLPELGAALPNPTVLRARGIAALFRSRRIKVPPTGPNYKSNFTPARGIWSRELSEWTSTSMSVERGALRATKVAWPGTASGSAAETGAAVTRTLQRDPVLDEIVRRLVDAFHPERIYLFGSKARGDAGPDSDYDLMVVVPNDAPEERKRSRLAYERLWGTGTAADVLVWTRERFESRTCLRASLPSTILREGRLLYAA